MKYGSTLRTWILLLLAAATLLCTAAITSADAQERYQYIETAEGIVRVDTATGSVARCTILDNPATCRLIADDRGALMQRFDALEDRLAALEERLNGPSVLGPALPPYDSPSSPSDQNAEDDSTDFLSGLPTDQELDEFFTFSEQFILKFFDVVGELRRSLEDET